MIDDLELTSPVLYLLFRSREFTLCFVSILFFRPSLRREEYYSHKTGTCSRVSKRKCIFPIKTKKNLQNKWWGWFFGCSSSSSGKHSVCPWPTGQFTFCRLLAAGCWSLFGSRFWHVMYVVQTWLWREWNVRLASRLKLVDRPGGHEQIHFRLSDGLYIHYGFPSLEPRLVFPPVIRSWPILL